MAINYFIFLFKVVICGRCLFAMNLVVDDMCPRSGEKKKKKKHHPSWIRRWHESIVYELVFLFWPSIEIYQFLEWRRREKKNIQQKKTFHHWNPWIIIIQGEKFFNWRIVAPEKKHIRQWHLITQPIQTGNALRNWHFFLDLFLFFFFCGSFMVLMCATQFVDPWIIQFLLFLRIYIFAYGNIITT